MIHFLKEIFKKKEEGPVFFNILTRTSGRPNGFKKCHESIQGQTFRHFSHIVSYDTHDDLTYLEEYDVKRVEVKKKEEKDVSTSRNPGNGEFSPHNLYFNSLLKEVKHGWIMLLDDDDMLAHPVVLEELAQIVQEADKRTMMIWQMEYPDGRLLPTDQMIAEEELQLYGIGTPCFLFHHSYATKFKWDAWKCADYRFVKQLSHAIPKKIWLNKAYVRLNNFGDFGQRNDLSNLKES